MDLRRIGTIFRKELLDTLRDKKTLIFMVALPMLLAPGLVALMSRLAQSEQKKTQERRLAVQAEPEVRDRLVAFLRGRLATLDAQAAPFLELLGAAAREPLEAIARDVGTGPLEVLIRSASDPAVRDHPRFADLKSSFAGVQKTVMTDASLMASGAAGDGPDEEALRAFKQISELVSPLVTIDFVTADEACARPATHPPAPLEELPARVRSDPRLLAAAQAIAQRQVQGYLSIPSALDAGLAERDDQAQVQILYDSTLDLSDEAHRRLKASLEAGSKLTVEARLVRESLPATFVTPVAVVPFNTAPRQKQALKLISSLLPYMLILMCFIGGLYPATDLGAGEKERLTLETLLVSPAARSEIAIGKFGVVFLASLVASLLATGSLAWTFTSGMAGKELSALIKFDLSFTQVAVCLALVAPLAAVFASVMLALSIYAKSQKEAQSMMMPLQFLILVPAMVSMIPTIELDARFAWVPVLNIALGLRAVLTAGSAALPWPELAMIFGSTLVLAAAALAWCSWWFRQEKVIFRS